MVEEFMEIVHKQSLIWVLKSTTSDGANGGAGGAPAPPTAVEPT